ncbi:glycosyl hydrolase [Spirosoma lacussanchae]|uniref:glycosyl hydrolase n=1 Tax=Spirosoma lacussanchae TaxID=1884249 RepID=UPI001107BB7D|nr:glycosyl hydrolase [Spirosoma lacussanchae]
MHPEPISPFWGLLTKHVLFPAFLAVFMWSGLAWGAAGPVRIEAETGVLTGVTIATTTAGFSGTGYVTGFDQPTDNLVLTINAQAGLYELRIGYASPFGDKGIDFQLNTEKGSATLRQRVSFSTASLGSFMLREGANRLTLSTGWGYYDIDYLLVTPTVPPIPVQPPKTLTDAQATASTRGLFSYLVDQYGRRVISGQQDDVEYILEKTGKEPAIGAFDLIDYSPSRVANGARPLRASEAIIDWARKEEGRGIISLMWHWNAPTDLINQAPDKLWWRGFYTEATTFDLSAALADKSSDRYKLLLHDIDAIADQLKKFQAADIPVLWRPLHEASGGWFWWGAKGAGPFRELWRLTYDRLTNYHNLHNLIWVYTATDTFEVDWYPGDSFVDVVGLDVYADASANLSGNWKSALDQLNGKKLIALSETGHVPNASTIRGFGTWWSWFSVWTGTDYIKRQPISTLQAVFTDVDIITRDELPNWRLASSALVTSVDPSSPFQLTLLGNPIQSDQIQLELTNPDQMPLTLLLTDLSGSRVLERTVESTTRVIRQKLPTTLRAGVYFLQVSSPRGVSTFRIVNY